MNSLKIAAQYLAIGIVVETSEYGLGTVLEQLKGKPQVFTWKVDGTKWQHNGKLSIGVELEEAWERVEKN